MWVVNNFNCRGFGPLLEDKLCLIFKLAPSVCRMTFPILASLLVRLVVLLPFQLLRLSLATPSDRKSGSAGMPRPISYAVFCLKKKMEQGQFFDVSRLVNSVSAFCVGVIRGVGRFSNFDAYVPDLHSFPTRRSSDLKLCLIFKLAPSVCRMTFPILASLLVRLVVLLPFQLLRLSLATPSRWTPLALSVFLHCVVALLLTLL